MTNKEYLKDHLHRGTIKLDGADWNCNPLYRSLDYNCDACFIRFQNDGDCRIITRLIQELKQDEPELFL